MYFETAREWASLALACGRPFEHFVDRGQDHVGAAGLDLVAGALHPSELTTRSHPRESAHQFGAHPSRPCRSTQCRRRSSHRTERGRACRPADGTVNSESFSRKSIRSGFSPRQSGSSLSPTSWLLRNSRAASAFAVQGGGIGLITTKPETSFAYACANMKVITPPAEVPTRKYGGGISPVFEDRVHLVDHLAHRAKLLLGVLDTGRRARSRVGADWVRSSECAPRPPELVHEPPLPCVRITRGTLALWPAAVPFDRYAVDHHREVAGGRRLCLRHR